jgi:hypothetical protein
MTRDPKNNRINSTIKKGIKARLKLYTLFFILISCQPNNWKVITVAILTSFKKSFTNNYVFVIKLVPGNIRKLVSLIGCKASRGAS